MYDELSQREQQVLALVVDGCTNKAIGRELGISHRTVEVYRGQLMEKLGARGTADLVRIALCSGLLMRKKASSSIGCPAFRLARLAERVGFEPTNALRRCQFSRLVPSTTRPPLRNISHLGFCWCGPIVAPRAFRRSK
jgi:DNA-binding CsgD family transcriptional regulator